MIFNTFLPYLSAAFFFLSPLAVCSAINHILGIPLSSLITCSIALSLLIIVFYNKIYFCIDEFTKVVLICIALPVLLSSTIVLLNIWLIDNISYTKYVQDFFLFRFILNWAFYIIFIVVLLNIKKTPQGFAPKIINGYKWGVYFIVVLGIWQWANIYLGIPFLDIETRNLMHSISEKTDLLFVKRLTSLTDEPAYFVTLIVDCFIIGLLSPNRKRIKMGICLLLLFFTFSLAGYVNLLIVLIAYMLKAKKNSKMFLGFGGLFLTLLLVAIYFYSDSGRLIFYPILGRIDGIAESARIQTIIYSISSLFEYSPINILFGFGPASRKFLSMVVTLPNGEFIDATANNLFIDYLYEYGFVGFFSAAFCFIYLIRRTSHNLRINKNRFSLCAYLFTVHLSVTSLYRSEYASPRFWCLLILIGALSFVSNSGVKDLSDS
ncbi:MAG: hypothetical protein E6X17_10785 [Sporomusaceae bacterium]|nr:hypothetical protein [Sporomusaceae bacterium]